MAKKKLSKILIMCGGRGRRLGKLAKSFPKPLMKIGDKAILELKFRNYMLQGFNDFIICIGYKGNMIRDAVKKFGFSDNCKFSDGGEPAGILKRLYIAKDLFDKEVILTYGDTYTDLNLSQLVKTHSGSDNETTIVVAPIRNPFGLVEFDEKKKVTSLKEKPVLNYYIGYAVVNKSALKLIPKKIIDMPDGEGLITFYRMLMAMGKLGVFYHRGLQITFNTENELQIAHEKIYSFYTAREEH